MQMDNSASEAQAAGAYEALEAQPELASCRKADCVVLTTDHSAFDYAAIAKESRLIVDTRNAFREFRGAKIIPFGNGVKARRALAAERLLPPPTERRAARQDACTLEKRK
jgi:hypothetical protein